MDNIEQQTYSIREAIVQVITKWKLLLLLALIAMLGALIRHKYYPVYPGVGKILIKEQGGSSLNTVLSQFGGASGLLSNQGAQNKIDRSLAYLETTEFNKRLATKLWGQLNDEQTADVVKSELKSFLHSLKLNTEVKTAGDQDHQQNRLANSLRLRLKWNKSMGGQLVVRIKTPRRAWTTHLVNEALIEAQKYLTEKELKDVDDASLFFNQEIQEVERRLRQLELTTLRALKKSDMLSVDAEKGEASQYLTTLRKNINDTEIKIKEGESLLKGLIARDEQSSAKTEEETLSKFALSGQIRHLQDELQTLKLRRDTLKEYLKSYGGVKKSLLPVQNQMERIKTNYDFEYKVYENLRQGMAKLGLERTFIENQIVILESESALKVHSSPGLLILLLVAITLSQITGLAMIAIYELFVG